MSHKYISKKITVQDISVPFDIEYTVPKTFPEVMKADDSKLISLYCKYISGENFDIKYKWFMSQLPIPQQEFRKKARLAIWNYIIKK